MHARVVNTLAEGRGTTPTEIAANTVKLDGDALSYIRLETVSRFAISPPVRKAESSVYDGLVRRADAVSHSKIASVPCDLRPVRVSVGSRSSELGAS